jgi:hypothetical protein
MGTLLILFFIGSVLVLHRLYTKPSRPSVAHGGHSSVDSSVVPGGSGGVDAGTNCDPGGVSCDGGGGGCDGG